MTNLTYAAWVQLRDELASGRSAASPATRAEHRGGAVIIATVSRLDSALEWSEPWGDPSVGTDRWWSERPEP